MCFSESAIIDQSEHSLTKPFVEYIDGARLYLEGESDRDLPTLQDIRLHYSKFVRHLIGYTPGEVPYKGGSFKLVGVSV